MNYTQDGRLLSVTTPLGKDKLFLIGINAREGISRLFSIQLEALAENKTVVSFNQLLGRKVTAQLLLPDKSKRFFNGIVRKAAEKGRDQTFTSYAMELVPEFWLLTRQARSRIFQQTSVPDILKKVFTGMEIDDSGLHGTFEKRDYCVQYRETDFNFASRLMEEEGIFYFFRHTTSSHTMVLANTPAAHEAISKVAPSEKQIIYEELTGGLRPDDRIYSWVKSQEVRSEKVTLWDHSFERPHQHLQANKEIQATVQAGTVSHTLKIDGKDLELYDWPGQYAQRFDGIAPGGGEQPPEIQKIFQDNERTAGIRMEEAAVEALVVQGTSNCRGFTSGYQFKLDRHFNANGPYVLTTVQHSSREDAYRSNNTPFYYENIFTCIPLGLPFRPTRLAEKPVVSGTQTAVVVGPSGDEIFTDKYGRVQVRFHWDRENKNSCWIRVAQLSAGKRWGSSFWPRIGQEVVIAFEEGDPDRPIIVGSVYNSDQMPPYLGDGLDPKHKRDNKVSGIKTNSTKGGQGFNEWRFDDTKGKEEVFIHAEKDLDTRVKNDVRTTVGGSTNLTIGFQDKAGDLHGFMKEKIFRTKETHALKSIFVRADNSHIVFVGDPPTCTFVMLADLGQISAQSDSLFTVKAGDNIAMESDGEINLKCGESFIKLTPEAIFISGPLVNINSGGTPFSVADIQPNNPNPVDDADDSKSGMVSAPPPAS